MTALPSPAPHRADSAGAALRRPIRVAAVLDTFDVSGPGRQLVGVAIALAAVGVEMRVVMFHRRGRAYPPFAEYMAEAGVPFVLLPEDGPLDTKVAGRLQAALEAWPPDIVETHSYKTTMLVYLLRRLGRIAQPWVGFFHGATTENLKVRIYHQLDGLLLRAADRTVVMSKAQRRNFEHFGDRVHIVYNSVVPLPDEGSEQFALPAPVEAAAAAGEPVVGVVGRLSPEKGVDIYLRAVAELERRGVKCMSVLAGDGPQRGAAAALAAELGIEHRLFFLGSVRSMQALYRRLDLLVIPSRSEGLPNVLLEAMRADLPVVSTSVGAIPEVIEGTRAGVLVPPGDALMLADAIAGALTLKHDAASRASRAEVAERFSLEHRALAHREMYDEMLARASRSGRA
jgi:glycosyltransferase involved in cell wall biosynthesis